MIPNEAAMVDRIVTINAIRITYQTELASKFPFATERRDVGTGPQGTSMVK